ncbi:MAG: hypothetical protein J7L61_03530, partial [Thermoplasmata archaeon]|nr:hypothetical protein [Thermoplasmata archaeon]
MRQEAEGRIVLSILAVVMIIFSSFIVLPTAWLPGSSEDSPTSDTTVYTSTNDSVPPDLRGGEWYTPLNVGLFVSSSGGLYSFDPNGDPGSQWNIVDSHTGFK